MWEQASTTTPCTWTPSLPCYCYASPFQVSQCDGRKWALSPCAHCSSICTILLTRIDISIGLTTHRCLHTFFVLRDSGVLASLEDMLRPRTCQYCHRDLQTMWAMKMENQNQNQNSLKTDNSVAAPVQLATQAQPSAPEAETASISAPTARPASISPSNFTAPRPSTDYDAETLRSVDATIRLV